MNGFYTSVEVLGDNVLVRYVDGDKHDSYEEEFYPTLFFPTKKQTKFKTLNGDPVDKIKPGNITECRKERGKWKKKYNIELHGLTDWNIQYIGKEFDDCQYDFSKIKVMNIDIETGSENGFPNVNEVREEVISITLKDNITKKFVVLGCEPYSNSREDVYYIHCIDERALLSKFLDVYKAIDPDVITGWNVRFFDIPYLVRRIDKILGEKTSKKLSHWNFIREKNVVMNNRDNITYKILGVSILDYMELYKKYTYSNQESYRLQHIADVELGEGKLSYEEYGNLHNLYKENYQKFIDYNIKDVELVDKLDSKLNLLELIMTLAYTAGCNYEDVYGQTRFWDYLIYNHLRKQNIVVPSKDERERKKDKEFEGAYVKIPITGMHDWIVSFDLASLYPHLIMQYNISPETFLAKKDNVDIDELVQGNFKITKKKDSCMAANGYYFSTGKKGFLPQVMENMYNERDLAKRKMLDLQRTGGDSEEISRLDTLQMAMKIALNSAYGAMGNQYFRYFDIRLSEAITKSGQLSIRWIERKLNEYLNGILGTDNEDYIVASDTDSVYLTMGSFVENCLGESSDKNRIINFLDRVSANEIQQYINESFQELYQYMGSYQQKMSMKREVIAEKGIWTAKKRYVLNVWDNEGVRYENPKIKIMGIEAVRSSTPQACRAKILELMELIMEGTEGDVIDYIADFRDEWSDLPVENISFPRSVNHLDKYHHSVYGYIKGTPIQVRGSLLYNKLLDENNLSSRYERIQNGEKIKFTYLKEPNSLHDNVIAYVNTLPKEFGLDKYIDYDLQFEKSYIDPIKTVLDVIGWKHEKTSSLEGFFG